MMTGMWFQDHRTKQLSPRNGSTRSSMDLMKVLKSSRQDSLPMASLKKEGIDYDDIFAPVARYTTIRSIIVLAATQGWSLHQMDVKTTFLHGAIKQEVYVEQPLGFEVQDHDTHVCKLKKALYGLKQAPRAWYERIDSYLMKLSFTRSNANSNLYFFG